MGPAGAEGVDGIDGKEVTFQVREGFIQWQYVGDTVWNALIDLSTITGADGRNGTNGIDGREVLFQVAEGYIQWQYTGDTTWRNLVDINTLSGVQGIGIANTLINQYGELIITYTNNTEVNIGTIYRVYTVNFIGLQGYLIDSQSVIYGSDIVAPTPPIIKGYTFTGWSQTFTNINSNMSINAIYKINTYTLTFLTEGGLAIEPISNIEYNSTITLPIPSKEGYIFKGWFTGNTVNDGHFTNLTKVKDNITLYARWESRIFTVKFVDIDDIILKEVKVFSGESAVAPTAPEITGYTFTGWTQQFVNVIRDTIAKATYSINQYTITFDSNDGSLVETITQDYGTEVIEPTEPTKEGYTFVGWYVDAEFTTSYTFKTMPGDDITVYAKWQNTIIFDSNGGTLVDEITQDFGAILNEPTNPIREGYSFAGWYSDSLLMSSFTFATMPSQNITLYAKWTINQYTITFDTNDGTFVEEITQDYGTEVIEPTEPTKYKHIFLGWKLNLSSSTYFLFEMMPAENIILYADWKLLNDNYISYESRLNSNNQFVIDFTISEFVYFSAFDLIVTLNKSVLSVTSELSPFGYLTENNQIRLLYSDASNNINIDTVIVSIVVNASDLEGLVLSLHINQVISIDNNEPIEALFTIDERLKP